ncbi:12343_t:CDS:2, partial [Acaulospora colombiana]
MSQQNQNLPSSNLPNAQPTTNAGNTSDQFSSFQQASQNALQNQQENQQRTPQQPPQSLSQAPGSPLPQATTTSQQPSTTPQIQPASAVSVNIRPSSVAARGGGKKKPGGVNKKTTGVRPKLITTEKNELPQALSKMADDYLNQVNQYGKDTPEGQVAYKNYIDTIQALQQHQRNNQLGNFQFTPATNQQTTPPASTPSPHQMPRMISSAGPSPLASQQPRVLVYPEYSNIQNIQQLRNEMNKITNLLSSKDTTNKTDLMNRFNTLTQLSSVKFGTNSNTGSMQHMSPQSPYNSPRSYLGTQGNDYNRIATASSQSPSSPLSNSTGVSSSHVQDGSIITSPPQQQQQISHQVMQQQLQQLHNNPQSPSSQQPPQSPLSQTLPPSPRTQPPPSQPPQSQPPR